MGRTIVTVFHPRPFYVKPTNREDSDARHPGSIEPEDSSIARVYARLESPPLKWSARRSPSNRCPN